MELGDSGRTVMAPIAPGIIREILISSQSVMQIGQEFIIRLTPSVLALDGEREVEIRRGQLAAIRLGEDGPTVVDVPRTMKAAMKRNLFTSKK